MAGNDQVSKVDLVEGKQLDTSTRELMKLIEKENLRRVEKLKKLRSKNLYTGLFLGGAVVSIYAYSILAVKQETFLDDFEEPKLIVPKEDLKFK